MPTTTDYGSWAEGSNDTVRDTITTALGEFAAQYDVDAIETDYRAAINKRLPPHVTLNGNEFYGPYPRKDVDLPAIVSSVDFWTIAAKHEN